MEIHVQALRFILINELYTAPGCPDISTKYVMVGAYRMQNWKHINFKSEMLSSLNLIS